MVKAIEFIILIILLMFSFFAGVKYSKPVTEHASWLFDTKEEEESDFLDFPGEGIVKINSQSEEN